MSNWPGFDALIKDLERLRDNAKDKPTPFAQGVSDGIDLALGFLKHEIHRMTLDAQLKAQESEQPMSDREEWRSALRSEPVKPGDCYRHDMRLDGSVGVCARCGLTVTGDEL